VNDVLILLLLVALLLGNAFFVAAEFALVTARPDQLEPHAAAGSTRARTTVKAMRNVSSMMAGAQLGITLCSLGLGAVGEPAVAHLIEAPMAALGVPEGLLHPIALVIALSIVTVLHMVLGEMVPKNITIAGPDRAALVLGPPLAAFVRVLGPVIRLFNAVANAMVRAVGVQPTDEVAAGFDETEIHSMITRSRQEGRLVSEVGELAAGALTFYRDELEPVLLPVDRLVTVPRSTTPRQLEAAVAEHGFSRYPVREDDGALAGYVHVKAVLGVAAGARDRPIADEHAIPFIPLQPGAGLPDVLAAMRDGGARLGRVLDGGRTVGLVALEDVLERLIGDIRDAAAETSRRIEDPDRGATGAGAGAGGG
jgi:CBS domain containing-hemolysin-like protein